MRQIWIIRFSDGTVGSCYGTREGAIELADLRKDDYGESYTIEGGENDGERTYHFAVYWDCCGNPSGMAMGFRNRASDQCFYDHGNCIWNNPVDGG